MNFTIRLHDLEDLYIRETEDTNSIPNFQEMIGAERRYWATKATYNLWGDMIRHGDTIFWIHIGEMNTNLLFWHMDTGAIDPCYKVDPCGGVPECFPVGNQLGEFALQHWEEHGDTCNWIYVSKSLLDQIQIMRDSGLHTVSIRGTCVVVNILHNRPLHNAFHISKMDTITQY